MIKRRGKEGEKKESGAGERRGWERAGPEGAGGGQEKDAHVFLSHLGPTVCVNSRISVPGWMARRKCLTDEVAHGAVTWDVSGLAKWGQVAGQLPWRKEFRPSPVTHADGTQ